MRTKPFIFLTLFLAFASCNRLTPAGFWKNYKNYLIVKTISDQGPNGGHRAIYWKSDRKGTFTSYNVLEFARRNGWIPVDSLKFNRSQTSQWFYNNKAVFPLTSIGISDTHLNDAHLTDFPRWFGGQISVYRFKTNWVTIEPGTDNSIEKNGFVVINRDGTEMAVYHLWGE